MVKTGYISFITQTGGGKDASGNFQASTLTTSVFITCNLNIITKEYKIIVDGQSTQLKYICYVDLSKFRSLAINYYTIRQVIIRDYNSNTLGTHQVQNIEHLNLARQIKIMV